MAAVPTMIMTVEVSKTPSGQMGLKVDDVHPVPGGGLRVLSCVPGGQADQAGLRGDDVLLEANGVSLNRFEDLAGLLQRDYDFRFQVSREPTFAEDLLR